jgi:hypothetical protein
MSDMPTKITRPNAEERADEDTLNQVVRESRTDLRPPKFGPSFDWDKIEGGLLGRIEEESARNAALLEHRGSARVWGTLTVLVAAAAAVTLMIGRSPSSATADARSTALEPRTVAGSLTAQGGVGAVRISNASGEEAAAKMGASVRVGDEVETHGVRALFEANGRATWLVEDESDFSVTRAGNAAIVLALEHGAVEAQVVPVAAGEAFAVDVGDVRVAVHGTHLRVARDGDGVTVDLTEGVVSIGKPPKVGSTFGTIVMAPAHVEFSADDLARTLSIDHGPASVRHALSLSGSADSTPALAATTAQRQTAVELVRSSPHSPVAAPPPAMSPRLVAGKAASQQALPNAEETITTSVQSCATGHLSDVTLVVNSTLTFDVGEDGMVKGAGHYDPPLHPDIQNCVAPTLFQTHFAPPGEHKISITLHR